jgi:ATP-dependent helicase/nuclease subunit A
LTDSPAYRVDGRLVSSAVFYGVACDPRRSAVVEACAGAGKTWMLVSRVLRALLDGAEPQQILAITFTRKAAGEMRQRLAEWLAEFAAPETSDARRIEALRERGVDAAQAPALLDTLAGLYERVLAGGRAVQIHTFHAWFSQLLRAAPIELLSGLGLQPGMQLIEDRDELEPELLRRFHAALLRDDALRADYTRLVHQRGRSQVRKWLLAALDKRVEIELADAAGTLETSVPGVAESWPEFAGLEHPAQVLDGAAWRAALRELALALGRGGVRAQDAAAGLALALAADEPAARFEAAWAALFTREGTPRRQLGNVARLAEVQADLERLGQCVHAHEARLEHLRMVRLARLLLADYAALKRARALADMADLERCALELLRDSELSAWVQQRLDTQLRHVLIDEFQDTSPLQWHALHAWLAGYAGAGGGASGQRPPGVFIVGDPKQSIYRFRRAEPRVFEAAREFVRDGLGGAVLECDHTRRNRPEVLDTVNAVFEAARDAGGFDGFRAHTSALPPCGGAAVLALPGIARPPREASPPAAERVWRDSLTTPRHEPEEVLRQREADAVALAIAELVEGEGVPPGEIMVLSRKRAPLRLLAQALRPLHIAYAAAEDALLGDSPEARDLIALLDALASPRHNLSLAHALRSPLFGADDDDLVALAQAAASRASSWWEALQAASAAALSPALQRAQQLLAAWREAAARLPPHDLLDRIVADGDVHARVAAAVPPERRRAALADIDALLGQALALDGGRYATPYGFVRALRRRVLKIAAPADPQAVQLLTVHGAKGLEARVVFVMDAAPEAQPDDTATLLVDWPVASPVPRRCAFIAAESRPPITLAAPMASEQAARRREELNGLYVAMTRARERLVFSHTEPLRGDDAAPSWWQRVQPLTTPWSPLRAAPGAGSAPRDIVLRVLPRWQATRVPRPEAPPHAAAAASEATRLGQAVHRLLEWSSADVEEGREGLEAAAQRAGAEFGLAPAHAAGIARFARQILCSADCRRFFTGSALRWAGNEVGVGIDGEVRRIDRLVQLADGGWWVLDYKLAAAPQREADNLAQLRGYRAAVAALQPGAEVRAAFINGAGEVIEID